MTRSRPRTPKPTAWPAPVNGSVPSGEALGVGDDVGSGVGVVGSGVGAGVVGCGVVGSGVGVGSGVRSVTQYPADVPDQVIGQLGNRIQHALRAYTPADRTALRAAAASLARPKN